ncbi:MAG: hypothetical protein IRY86_07970 [Thermorudis peleae]|nr:hypothetical protein [Thermorudis peleae]
MSRWLPVPIEPHAPEVTSDQVHVTRPASSFLPYASRALDALNTLAELARLSRNVRHRRSIDPTTPSPQPLTCSYELVVTMRNRQGQHVTIHERQTVIVNHAQSPESNNRALLSWRPGWRTLGLAGMLLVLGLTRAGRGERHGQWPPQLR